MSKQICRMDFCGQKCGLVCVHCAAQGVSCTDGLSGLPLLLRCASQVEAALGEPLTFLSPGVVGSELHVYACV